jgi:tRNA-splicing ligase RtcB (3'-phosphate/5'-hydroxy nucleic acid ligase)
MLDKRKFERISDVLWEIAPGDGAMRVPARVWATESMLDSIVADRSLQQLMNVASLPGIRRYAIVMPDVHEGYGFPIGGVAAFDPEEGVISPGGIGYDINCGVRLLRSGLKLADAGPRLDELAEALWRAVPSGLGKGGRRKLGAGDFDEVLRLGAQRVVEMGHGKEADLERIESRGRIDDAEPSEVSAHARERARDQLGTMGGGNHFVEVEAVERIFDQQEATRLGLEPDGIVVLIHTGSRGLGHQVATDFLKVMSRAMVRYGITVADRELACAPFASPEGRRYFGAMSAAANFAWANRQMITDSVRRVWERIFGTAGGELEIVYDVAHNVAKLEEHEVDGRRERLLVHRKGATRAFPGQPVIIPGSMGTGSYVLVGREGAMRETFGSSCHGAGRRMSRTAAKRTIDGAELRRRLEEKGIAVRAGSTGGLVEEAPEAYKDVDEVVDVVDRGGIAAKVARLRPLAVVKG